ncbi:MAG: phage major capsid protein [Limimaricola soesokkakensis]|uniref:phage major capsid protein n=1 Tax=Limimaricola soesokkakensis TaxID=1343159 RepID=UPI004059A35C
MTPKELREKRARLVENARGKLAEIQGDTPDARAAEINREAEAMIAEAEGLAARAETLDRLDRAERALDQGDARRPDQGAGEARLHQAPAEISYRQAFGAYMLAQGQRSDMTPEARAALLRGQSELPAEMRAQTAGADTAGGYTVPDEMMRALVKAMAAWGPMFDEDITTGIDTAGGGIIPIPTVDDTGNEAAKTATEGATLGDTGAKDVVFGRKTLEDHMIDTEWLRVSVQLASGSMEAMEKLLADLLGERLGRKANRWLTTGTGTGEPAGIVTGAGVGHTAASGTAITADEILEFFHSVDPAYRASPKARVMFNDATLLRLHQLKDGQGNYLIRNAPDGSGRLTVGAVSVPYSVNQAMAGIGLNNRSMVFGDFSKYFTRRIGNAVVGAIQDKDFWPGFGVAGYQRLDGVLADAAAVKAFVHPAT